MRLAASALLLALSGCTLATYGFEPTQASAGLDLDQSKRECGFEADKSTAGISDIGLAVAKHQIVLRSCMEAKGFKVVQTGSANVWTGTRYPAR